MKSTLKNFVGGQESENMNRWDKANVRRADLRKH